MTQAELQARITQVEDMVAARRGKPGFASNVAACEAELLRLKAELAALETPETPD